MTVYSHIVTIRIHKDKKELFLKELGIKYPKSKTKAMRDYGDNKSLLVFHNDSNQSSNALEGEIIQMDGVISAEITSKKKSISWLPTSYSSLLIIGLFITFIIFSILVFSNNEAVTKLTGPQILIIELAITLSITIWLYRYDKKWEREVTDVLLDIDSLSSEIREYVKDLSSKENKKSE